MLFTPGHFIRKETLTRLLENAQEPSANLIREVTEGLSPRTALVPWQTAGAESGEPNTPGVPELEAVR